MSITQADTQATNAVGAKDTTYDHIVKYTGLFGGVQGLTMLMNLVRNKIASVLLGPEGLALINLYNNAIRLLNEASSFGISISAVKRVAELFDTGDEEQQNRFAVTLRTWCLYLALLGTFAGMALAPWLSLWTFETYEHTLAFILLAPMVGMLTLTSGELAILKGMKQLKKVAIISVVSAAVLLLISTPLYLIWRVEGVVASLLLCQAAILGIHLYYSTKSIPWRAALTTKTEFGQGLSMLRIGLGYVIAGIFGQGAEYIIRVLILQYGSQADVGLYYSGYTLTVTYASMVFVAFEADYFPRLSATSSHLQRQNQTVNQQITVSILLMAPILSLFVLVLPILIPLLFSSQFTDAIPMATTATFYMFFKSALLAVAYLPLARGDSKMYMLTELFYDILIAFAVPYAFLHWGLTGTGWALSFAGLIQMLLIHLLYRYRYKYKLDRRPIQIFVIQLVLFTVAFVAANSDLLWITWSVGPLAFLISAALSYRFLSRETHFIQKLKDKLKKKS